MSHEHSYHVISSTWHYQYPLAETQSELSQKNFESAKTIFLYVFAVK